MQIICCVIDKNITKVKQVVYWPYMANDFKNCIFECESCNKYKRANVKQPLLSHELVGNPCIVVVLKSQMRLYLIMYRIPRMSLKHFVQVMTLGIFV